MRETDHSQRPRLVHYTQREELQRSDKFIPEWCLDPDNTDQREASDPFSLGPRACIGQK